MSNQWLGQWQGNWFGAGAVLGPGFISGSASIRFSGTGTLYSGVTPSWLSGAANLVFSGQGTISDTPGPRWISGTSHLQLLASGGIVDANAVPLGPELAQGAGAVGNDHGTGYVWKDHGWVKAVKTVRIGFSVHHSGVTLPRVRVGGAVTRLRTKAFQGSAFSTQAVRVQPTACRVSSISGTTHAHSECAIMPMRSIVSSYNGACETLSLDELIALMGMAA